MKCVTIHKKIIFISLLLLFLLVNTIISVNLNAKSLKARENSNRKANKKGKTKSEFKKRKAIKVRKINETNSDIDEEAESEEEGDDATATTTPPPDDTQTTTTTTPDGSTTTSSIKSSSSSTVTNADGSVTVTTTGTDGNPVVKTLTGDEAKAAVSKQNESIQSIQDATMNSFNKINSMFGTLPTSPLSVDTTDGFGVPNSLLNLQATMNKVRQAQRRNLLNMNALINTQSAMIGSTAVFNPNMFLFG